MLYNLASYEIYLVMSQVFGSCGLCAQPITGDTQRVEIAIPASVKSGGFVLAYQGNGVAKLHNYCWKHIQQVLSITLNVGWFWGHCPNTAYIESRDVPLSKLNSTP